MYFNDFTRVTEIKRNYFDTLSWFFDHECKNKRLVF